MTAKLLKKGARYEDLCRVPDCFVAEMFDGDLYDPSMPSSSSCKHSGAEHT